MGRAFRKRRAIKEMFWITLGFILFSILLSTAIFRDSAPPPVKGMSEEQILAAYAKQIKAEAKWRAHLMCVGAVE